MTKIDVFSGFLGAGKTTLIKKLISEAYENEKLVLIENEFGETGIDGGFLKESGIQINEMNSGCICCSLVGDFKKALSEVLEQFKPDRILIEPSGVGKLSDVIKAVMGAENGKSALNAAVAVVDANKCKMYMKNFGEFFSDQVEFAKTIVLSRTSDISEEKLDRLLTIMNWTCTQDGQLTVVVGVPGETWEYDENGDVKMLTEKDENGNYPSTPDLYNSYNIFRSLGILPDDYSFVNPSNEKLVVEQIKAVYAAKERGYIIPLDYDYEFFASDAKSQFSLDFQDEITRIILLKDADVAAEWNNFLNMNKAIWEPVITDLNNEFFK